MFRLQKIAVTGDPSGSELLAVARLAEGPEFDQSLGRIRSLDEVSGQNDDESTNGKPGAICLVRAGPPADCALNLGDCERTEFGQLPEITGGLHEP